MKLLFLSVVTLSLCLSCSSCNSQQKNSPVKKDVLMKQRLEFDTFNIENNFPVVSIDDINTSNVTFNGDSNFSLSTNTLAYVFLEPINEIQFSKSYIESVYKSYYRLKISDSLWLLSYHHHYDLHDYDVVWVLYNSKEKLITSKIVIESSCEYLYRELKHFDGTQLRVYTKYKRHMENGMEGDNSKPIEVESTYLIKNGKFVAQ